MRREPGLNFAGGSERGFIQFVQILANRAGRICWINLRDVPVLLRRRVLLVRLRLDRAGIHRHALAADQPSSMQRATVVSKRCASGLGSIIADPPVRPKN